MLLIAKVIKILMKELYLYAIVSTTFGICASHALHHVNIGSFIFVYVRSRGTGTQGADRASTSQGIH
jgi:hypothetical protein